MSDDHDTARQVIADGQSGVDSRGVSGFTQSTLIGGSVMAITIAIVEVVVGIPSTIMAPVRAFMNGIATFVGGTLGATVRVTDASATASATSFLEGTGAALGPLAFPAGVAVTVAAMYIFLIFIRRISVSPTQLYRRIRR